MTGATSTLQSHTTKQLWYAAAGKCVIGLAVTVMWVYAFASPAHAMTGHRLLLDAQVNWYALTPDGREIVVLAQDVPGDATSRSLYRVRVDGSAPPQRLSGELVVDQVYGLSPDGRTVVFHSTSEHQLNPLYSVRVRGGSPIHLGATFQESTWITDVRFTPDNQAVVVRTETGMAEDIDLYYVPLAGSAALHLVSKPGIATFDLSPDGDHLVYLLITNPAPTLTRYTLYSVPLAGGPEVELHKTAQPYSAISNIDFGLGGDSVLYLADETVNNLYELYQVPILGGAPVNLSRPAFFPQPQADPFAVTPDGATAIFQTNRTLEHPYELYSVPITHGAPLPLAPVAAGQNTMQPIHWQCAISADGQWLTYTATEGEWVDFYGRGRGADLYHVAVKRGDALHLNQREKSLPLPVADGEYCLSPDGHNVVFRVITFDGVGAGLYSVPTAGGQPVLLTETGALPQGWPDAPPFSPDGRWLYFEATSSGQLTPYYTFTFWRVPVTGGAPQHLFGMRDNTYRYTPLPEDGQVLFLRDAKLYATYEMSEAAYLPILTRAPTSITGAPTGPATKNLITLLKAQGNFTALLTALDAAGLTDALRDAGPFTIFAPTDAAFAALPSGALGQLLDTPTGQLTQILLFHILPGTYTASAIVDGMQATTQQGRSVYFEVTQGQIKVNGANIITSDLRARNGVIHALDAVILPPAE